MTNIFPHASARSAQRLLAFIGAVAAALNMTALAADPQASARPLPEVRLDTPSGLPVPRFVSLKAEKTFCRTGPTFSHPVRLTYQRQGLPVMIVAETRDHWRKIRDLEGDQCWIHRTKLSGAKTGIVIEDGLIIRTRPSHGAAQKARLGQGVVARIEKTRNGWVKITAPGVRGWAPGEGFWGAAPMERS